MPGETRFDLELLGYRNDLAREQVLRLLSGQPGLAPLARDTPLPRRLGGGLAHATGLRLLGALRDLGAAVRLVPSAGEAAGVVSQPAAGAAPLAAPGRGPAAAPRRCLGGARCRRAGAAAAATAPAAAAPAAGGAGAPRQLNEQAVALNAAGEYADAAARLRDALARDPAAPALQRNLKTVLQNWAVAELNAERPAVAVPLLEEALAIEEDGALLSALGIAQVRQDEWQQGRDTLERATALGAADPGTLTALAKAHRQLGDRAAAVEALHRARDAGAQGADFDAMTARLERELDAEWDFDELRSAHFSIGFAGGERDSQVAADLVARQLEDAYFHVGNKLDLYPGERVPVVLYPSEDFHDVTQTPSWTAGVYDGRIKLPVGGLVAGDREVLQRTLRHEYGHVLVHQLTRGRVPVWMNEGVAIWAEEERDGDRAAWAGETIAGRELFRLADLGGSFTALPAPRVPTAYAQSYLAVRALVDRHGPRRLRDLLERLGAGEPFDAAFAAAMYEEPAAFDAALIERLTRGS